jgi:uncharacterized protein with FMN-binding domain
MHRGLVALSASAIAAVYMAGYVRTQAADATLAAADPAITASPTAQVAVAAPPVASATPTPQVVVRRQPGTAPRSSSPPRAPTAPAAQASTAPAAQTPTPIPTQTPSPSVQAAYKDGTYTGQGTSRRGDVWVQVQVVGGRITNVSITRSTLQYPLRDIAGLPQQVVDRQSPQVDTVSRATYSSMAFRQAVSQALASARAG